MILKNRALLAVSTAAVLALTACGGGGSTDTSANAGPTGEAVSGGTGRIIETTEPRSLDPSLISNTFASSPITGNALYGTLLIDNPETGELEFKMAEDLSSTDGGKTFTLKVRPGIQFSDGTPFDAQAVKTGWEHIKDPATRSPDIPQASLVESSEVVDPLTLEVTLTEPVPSFPSAVLQTTMNWIASPASLAGGQQSMDSNPIGAGPYTLESWSRQDVIKLKRNENYYDDTLPNLDALEIRAIADPDQRYNTVLSGGADLAMEGTWTNLANAKNAGLQAPVQALGGGITLVLNTTTGPFDDVRARKAVATALDLDGINQTEYQGTGVIPATLFDDSSPFYEDTPLAQHNQQEAQGLFDELAAEGKPLEFTVSVFPGNKTFGEAVQTQLSTYKNVKVNVQVIDQAEYGKIMATKDYDSITSAVMFGKDPEPRLSFAFNSESSGNNSGINDAQLDAALQEGRVATDEADRVAAYDTVQNRLAELYPVIFYTRPSPGVVANANVGGIQQYGLGSVLPETLWIQK